MRIFQLKNKEKIVEEKKILLSQLLSPCLENSENCSSDPWDGVLPLLDRLCLFACWELQEASENPHRTVSGAQNTHSFKSCKERELPESENTKHS